MQVLTTSAQCRIESLEGRRLLSWSTVDDFAPTPQVESRDVTSDGAGGVYAVGSAYDASAFMMYGVVRHKAGNSSDWQTVATVPGAPRALATRLLDVAVSPNGDVYISGL